MNRAPLPHHRLRRLRASKVIRDALADVTLTSANLIYPLFVTERNEPVPVISMPGVQQWPVDQAVEQIETLATRGLRSFILFGVTEEGHKDPAGSFAADAHAPVNRVLAEVRKRKLDVCMIADLCFCEYTDHGHCGVLAPEDQPLAGTVDNDETLKNLAAAAAAQARAGAQIIAPSGMMDGQVRAIRQALDNAGFQHVSILSYSVKYASSFYGPFRDAGGGAMKFGDRRAYQMDFRRSREWRRELETDLAEGADMVMVKPAVAYLDILHQMRSVCDVPIAAYHVSGEYAMLHAAAEKGWVDLKAAAIETTLAIRRAGADLIVTYFAPDLLAWLSESTR